MSRKKIKLGELCKPPKGQIKESPNTVIDYIDISSVDSNSKTITGYQTMPFSEAPSRARKSVEKRSVIVSTVRPNLNAVAVFEKETTNKPVVSTGFCVLDSKENVDYRFIFNFCRSKTFIDDMVSQATGASYPAVTDKIIRSALIPEYSYEEQCEISAVLDRVAQIIESRKKELSVLDDLIKARFVEMFGDPIMNTKSMPIKAFSSCCIDMHQGINTVADKVEYQLEGYPIIQSKNITRGYLDLDDVRYLNYDDFEKYKEKYNPKPNDLLVCNIGTIGKTLIVTEPKEFLIAWNLFLIKINQAIINHHYIKTLLEIINEKHYYDQFLTGGTVKFINKKTMGAIPTMIPSMEQQQQFSSFVVQVDKSKVVLQKALDEAQLLFDSLMQEYFG